MHSNTAPSTPALVNEALPENWKDHIIKEKKSAPEMPTLVESAQSQFIASQRPPQGSRLSAWLHGSSAIGNERRPKATRSHTTTQCYSRTPRRGRSQHQPTALRHTASTRGVIDPVHSPTSSPWPLSNESFGVRRDRDRDRRLSTLEPYQAINRGEPLYPQSKTGPQRKGTRKVVVRKKGDRTCLPAVTDPKIRRKIIGCLFFGTLLTIVLTTYLALATSNALRGATFHAVFIFFILVLVIIFSHYLIRLCMLAFHTEKRFGHHRKRMQWHSDEEAGFAAPSEPIRVTMVQDEEYPISEGVEEVVEEEERELPPPPPAYGLWRSSVRADPNLIHWQSIGQPDVPDLQQEARALILAGSGHRPPSYTPEETVDVHGRGHGQPEVIATPPLPQLAERRQAATVNHMRHQYQRTVYQGRDERYRVLGCE
ncbi:hypothetical protein OEA41_006993 [Lepraria neglecta]|uniref:Uncharacterized protein n=1 Tax=Lepraria neglecta TaxID=209136 RepID=A0AAD9Z9T9_9LECA|nr:hypothetical protein OEA41_006993 [Lepraria neglecta]